MKPDVPKGWNGKCRSAEDYEHVAAEWFFRREGGFTPKEEQAFDDWLREDRRNAQAFAQIRDTWSALYLARDKIVPVEPAFSRRLRSSWIPVWLPATLGVAAAFSVAYLLWWRPVHFAETAVTEIGALRTMSLPDGSTVQLNTDSTVSVAFTPRERRVFLGRGEALFAVSKNPSWPFVVQANGVAVRAVGTAFNVRIRSEEVDILVTEGMVRVDDAIKGGTLLQAGSRDAAQGSPVDGRIDTAAPVVAAGQQVTINLLGAPPFGKAMATPVSAVKIEQTLAWQKHKIAFPDAPLSELVAEFNRYNRHKLVIIDPRLAKRRFGGTFPADDYEAFVRLLESTFGVVADRRDGETVLRLSP